MFNPLDLMGKLKEMQSVNGARTSASRRNHHHCSRRQRAPTAVQGMVVVTANANRKILKITVDADLMDRNDKEIMEDLIAAAVNKAMEAAENVAREEIGRVSNNFMPNIPGMDMSQFGR